MVGYNNPKKRKASFPNIAPASEINNVVIQPPAADASTNCLVLPALEAASENGTEHVNHNGSLQTNQKASSQTSKSETYLSMPIGDILI